MNCVGVRGSMPFQPCIDGARLRLARAGRAAPCLHRVRRIDGLLADLLDAQPLDEVVGALEIVGVLAVVLEEQLRGFERLLASFRRWSAGPPCAPTCRRRRRPPPASRLPAPMSPMSLTVASAQLRGQPTAAIFTLCGVNSCSKRRSISMPALVESCVPKRQNSVPTQVFTMRTPLVYACPTACRGRPRPSAGPPS